MGSASPSRRNTPLSDTLFLIQHLGGSRATNTIHHLGRALVRFILLITASNVAIRPSWNPPSVLMTNAWPALWPVSPAQLVANIPFHPHGPRACRCTRLIALSVRIGECECIAKRGDITSCSCLTLGMLSCRLLLRIGWLDRACCNYFGFVSPLSVIVRPKCTFQSATRYSSCVKAVI